MAHYKLVNYDGMQYDPINFESQGFIRCALCGVAIAGMGGPDYDSICGECAEKIKSQKYSLVLTDSVQAHQI